MDTSKFFDLCFQKSVINAKMILDTEGNVLMVNHAFTNNYGYENDEIAGVNFNILYNKSDRDMDKPKLELQKVLREGNSTDENYIVHKNGREIWTTGESVLVTTGKGEKFIVKDIVNLESTKQLQFFLVETEELLQKLFEVSEEVGILILDGAMKVIKANKAFLKIFEIDVSPESGSRLSDIPNPFWSRDEIRLEIRNIIVHNKPCKGKEFSFVSKSGEKSKVRMDSKVLETDSGTGKKIILILHEMS